MRGLQAQVGGGAPFFIWMKERFEENKGHPEVIACLRFVSRCFSCFVG